jgi:hypothetical protein
MQDVMPNPFALQKYSREQIWADFGRGLDGHVPLGGWAYGSAKTACASANEDWIFAWPPVCEACPAAVEQLDDVRRRRLDGRLYFGQSDAYYVPARLMPDFNVTLAIFSRAECWLECAVQTALRVRWAFSRGVPQLNRACAQTLPAPDQINPLANIDWMWRNRDDWRAHLQDPRTTLLHPIKLGLYGARPTTFRFPFPLTCFGAQGTMASKP